MVIAPKQAKRDLCRTLEVLKSFRGMFNSPVQSHSIYMNIPHMHPPKRSSYFRARSS